MAYGSNAANAPAGGMLTQRARFELLRGGLANERSSFDAHYRMLGDAYAPRRPRFSTGDTNRGDRRNTQIIDTTPALAVRTLRSGMMSGLTSPARPWFRLTTADPDLAEFTRVKMWLHNVGQGMAHWFLRSNLYNCLPIVYGDLGVFGTAAMIVEEDFESLIRCYPFAIGSYYIANDERLKVNVFMREFRYTVRQLIAKFGVRNGNPRDIDWSVFSSQVKSLYDNGMPEAWVDIVHAIIPNPNFDPRIKDAKFKKFLSVYYEHGCQSAPGALGSSWTAEDKFLRESGYDYMPVLCPRWETTGEDVYGTDCPGMTGLGDARQLQIAEKRIHQAIEKVINPPMTGPSSLKNQKTSILPGDTTWLDTRDGRDGFRPVHEIDPRIQEMEGKQQQTRTRLDEAFFKNLFLMLANDTRSDITAREIEERHEEKLLALGPVLEQLNQDLLDPLIDIGFAMMDRQGLLGDIPDELQGMPLKVDYISIMAQAQKMAGIAGIDRFAQFVGNWATVSGDRSILRKVDHYQMADAYADFCSVPPAVVRSDEDVRKMEQHEQQAAMAAQQQQQMMDKAKATRDLAAADTGGDNALTDLMDRANAGAAVPV